LISIAGPKLSPCTLSQISPIRSAVSSPFFALGVNCALKRIERDLPHHGVDHVFDLAGQQLLALLLVLVCDSSA